MSLGKRPSHIMKVKRGADDPELAAMLDEAFEHVRIEDLVQTADELAHRHQQFVGRINKVHTTGQVSDDDIAWLMRAVTSTRRDATKLTEALTPTEVSTWVRFLLDGEGTPAERIATCVERTPALDPRLTLECATGLLHNTDPHRFWLWTRWLWDKEHHTGVLPLMAGGEHNLSACTVAMGYDKVGSVTAMSMRFAEKTGLLVPDLIEHPTRSPFAADVFLASTYTVYMYGMTSWRLSREFNRLLPSMQVMMRRLLGLPRLNTRR